MVKRYEGRTGNIYTFEDDWTHEEAWAKVDEEDAKLQKGMTLGDVGVMAKQAGYAASSAAVGLADVAGNVLVPGSNIAGRLEGVGIAPDAMHKKVKEQYSPGMKADVDALDQAQGVGGTIEALVEHPRSLLPVLTDSAAQMVGGLGIAKQLPKVIGGIGRAAIGEGTVAAGAASEGIRADGEANTPQDTAIAIASGAGTGLFGFLGGKVAQKLGINDIDTVLATGEVQKVHKHFLQRMAEGGITEGGFEELPQSVQEQMWQNYATDRPLMEGTGKAGTLGAVAGGVMGGAVGALPGPAPITPENTNPTSRDLPPMQEVDPAAPPPTPALPVEASPLTDASEEYQANKDLLAEIAASLEELGLQEPKAAAPVAAPDPVTAAVNPQLTGLDEHLTADVGLTREVQRNADNFVDTNTSVEVTQRRVLRALGGSFAVGAKLADQPLTAIDTSQGPVVFQVGEDNDVRPSHYMKGVLEDIYRLAQEFNPTGVYAILPEDLGPVGSAQHAAGGYRYHNGIHYITPRHMSRLNKDGSHKKKEGDNAYSTYAKAQAWSTLGHEFGHSLITDYTTRGLTPEELTLFDAGAKSGKVDEALIAKLPEKAQATVRAWEKLRTQIMNKEISGKEAALRWLSPTKLMSKSTMEQTYGKGFGVFTPESLARRGMLEYQLDFNEFLAEQMTKMLYARGEIKVSKTLANTFKNYDPEGLGSFIDNAVADFLAPLLEMLKTLHEKLTGQELQREGVDATPEVKEWFELLAENARQKGLGKTPKVPKPRAAKKSKEVEDAPVDWDDPSTQNKARAHLQALVRNEKVKRNSPQHRQLSAMLNRKEFEEYMTAVEHFYKTPEARNAAMRLDLTEGFLDGIDRPGIKGKIEAWAAKYRSEILQASELEGIEAVIDRPGRTFGPVKDYVTVGLKVHDMNYLYLLSPQGYQNFLQEETIENLHNGTIHALMKLADHATLEFIHSPNDGGGISIAAFPGPNSVALDRGLTKQDPEGMLQLQGTSWGQRLQLFGEMLARIRVSSMPKAYNVPVTWTRFSGANYGKEGKALFELEGMTDQFVGYLATHNGIPVVTSSPLDAAFINGPDAPEPYLIGAMLLEPQIADARFGETLDNFTSPQALSIARSKDFDGTLLTDLPGMHGKVAIIHNPNSLYAVTSGPDAGVRMRFDLTTQDGNDAAGWWTKMRDFGVRGMADGISKLYNAQWYGLQLQQLAHMNPQWGWLTNFADHSLKYYRKVGEMHSKADAVLKQVEWMGKENLAKLSKFTIAEYKGGKHWTDLQDNGDGYWTHVPNAETYDRLRDFGIDPDSASGKHFLSLYIEAKNALQFQMDEMERVLIGLRLRKYAAMPDQRDQAIMEVLATFRVRRATPFWPQQAFGHYRITVVDTQGKKVSEVATDSLAEAKELEAKAIKTYGQDAVKSSTEDYAVSMLMRLPVEFIDEASVLLGLDMNKPEDRQTLQNLQELMQSLYAKTPDNVYDPNKAFIGGGSKDFQKNFANFAMKNANFIAKMEYRKYLQNAVAAAKNDAGYERFGKSRSQIQQAINFMEGTIDYMMNPQEEMAMARGVVAITYLAYNVKTAVLNVMGLMATWAVLNRELGYLKGTYTFGTSTVDAARTLGHEWTTVLGQIMTRAAQRANNSITDPDWEMVNGQPTELRRALEQAKQENVLDQSYAYYLSGQAMRGELSRMANSSIPGKVFKGGIDAGMSLFRATELLTRRASFLAAYEIQQKTQPNKTEKQRYEEATRLIGLMQGDYTKGNRPELFRGNVKSFIFIFMTYVQNQAWATYGGMDKGLKRQEALDGRVSPKFYRSYSMQMALFLLMMAGAEGLPFGENIMDVIDVIYKWIFNKSARTELREFLTELDQDPMAWTRGLAFNVGGFDVGKSIGLGRIIPGTDRIGQEYDSPAEMAGNVVLSATGIGGGYIKWLTESAMAAGDAMQAGMSLAPVGEKALARMPGGIGNIFKAAQWAEVDARGPNGGLLAWDEGATQARPIHQWEINGKALGFQPTSVSRGQSLKMDIQENLSYWKARKDFVYAAYGQATLIAKDREAIADARAALQRYNEQVPHPAMAITGKQLQQSLKRREGNIEKANQQTPVAKSMRGMVDQVKESY